jgi:hypothetical protein
MAIATGRFAHFQEIDGGAHRQPWFSILEYDLSPVPLHRAL